MDFVRVLHRTRTENPEAFCCPLGILKDEVTKHCERTAKNPLREGEEPSLAKWGNMTAKDEQK